MLYVVKNYRSQWQFCWGDVARLIVHASNTHFIWSKRFRLRHYYAALRLSSFRTGFALTLRLLKYQHPIFSRIGKALSLLELRRNYSKDRLTTSPFTTCINPGSLWGLNGDFWLGFFREAIRVNLWLPVNLYPPAQKDLAIKSNESTDMLIGRLDADLVSIAGGIQEFNAHLFR